MFKKIMLLMLFVVSVGTLFAVSDSIKIAEKNKRYVKVIKTKPPFQLCKKVFPGVEFYVKLYLPITPPEKTYFGKYNGKYYNLSYEYSNLYNQVKDISTATLYDYLLLFFQFNYLSRADSIDVSDLKPLKQKEKNKLKKMKIIDCIHKYNYKARLKVYNFQSYRDVEYIIYISVKKGLIEYIGFRGVNIIGNTSLKLLSFLSIPRKRINDIFVTHYKINRKNRF